MGNSPHCPSQINVKNNRYWVPSLRANSDFYNGLCFTTKEGILLIAFKEYAICYDYQTAQFFTSFLNDFFFHF